MELCWVYSAGAHRRIIFVDLVFKLTHICTSGLQFFACPSLSQRSRHNFTYQWAYTAITVVILETFYFQSCDPKTSNNRKYHVNSSIFRSFQYPLNTINQEKPTQQHWIQSFKKPNRSRATCESFSTTASIEFTARKIEVLILLSGLHTWIGFVTWPYMASDTSYVKESSLKTLIYSNMSCEVAQLLIKN